ncbi:MAG TPA: hypothetical protein VLY46_08705 [Usitatibacter sp.]|nr:hypothetical protein [Usitatibacter sp.]
MSARAEPRCWSPSDDMARLEVLDVPECARALQTVDALRFRWTRRNPAFPFFTLGAASYIDAAASRDAYKAQALRDNELLATRFDWLLERVRATLGSVLGAPVAWQPNAALPGFHIYLAHKIFEQPIASIHCDSQYELIDWAGCGEPDFREVASFTLALALPRHGGGLNVFDLHRKEVSRLDNAAVTRRVRESAMTYHPYRVGSMVLHSGNVMHQAAPGRDIQPDERRITLQGHCVRAGERWYAYW